MSRRQRAAGSAEMRPYMAWQVVSAEGNPWYEPQRTRSEAITEYISRATLPSDAGVMSVWAGEKRRGFRCERVLVKQWSAR